MRLVEAARRAAAVRRMWARYRRESPQAAPRDFRDWILTTMAPDTMLRDGRPWITFPAARWLAARVHAGTSVFEWGSGASTVFFSRRGARVVSIEHETAWHERVAERLRAESGDVRLRLVPPDDGDAARPMTAAERPLYQSTDARYEGRLFVRYVEAVLDYPVGSFDVFLVDGRSRVGCAVMAARQAGPGACVILDNAERPAYAAALAAFAPPEWEALQFDGPGPRSLWPAFWRTTAFVRRIR